MKKKWLRLYHGLPLNENLAVAAHRAGVSRAEMIGVWIYLLDTASSAQDYGSVAGLDGEAMAVTLELAPAAIEKAIAALRHKKVVLKDDRLAQWDKYQPVSTQRVKKHRARHALSKAPPPAAGKNFISGARPATRTVKPEDALNTSALHDPDSPQAVAARRARLQQTAAVSTPKRTSYIPAS